MNNEEKVTISGDSLLKAVLLISLLWAGLFYGSSLILPLLLSAIIAALLDKPAKKLKNWGFPNWLAISVSLILMTIILFLLFWLISSQIGSMAEDWPTIKEKASGKYELFHDWLTSTFQINPGNFLDNNFDMMDKLQSLGKTLISSLSNLLSQSFIIFVYIVLFLMQKKMFVLFFKKLLKNDTTATTILKESSTIISNYIFGKGKIMCFLFIIYYLGFSLGQVPFALFLALFASLFSIIPYVGNLIGGGMAIILAYLYSGGNSALIVIAVIAVTQLVENYILTPWIIGNEIDLNPFITVFGIILLSVLWGVVGAIIALPILGVLKVLFEHTKGMEAYAFLLKQHKSDG